MTLTKNEFKELYGLYTEAMDKFCEVSTYLNEGFADELIFPAFTWVEEKLGLPKNCFGDIWSWSGCEDPDESLAAIYKEYLEDRLVLLDEKLTEMEEGLNA